MKKIIVIGCMGSGKSTFAEKLHRKTKIPLFHLDNIWWKADRTHISREEFDSELNRIMQGDSWIIDGGPHKRRNMWFNSMIREEPYPGSNGI